MEGRDERGGMVLGRIVRGEGKRSEEGRRGEEVRVMSGELEGLMKRKVL